MGYLPLVKTADHCRNGRRRVRTLFSSITTTEPASKIVLLCARASFSRSITCGVRVLWRRKRTTLTLRSDDSARISPKSRSNVRRIHSLTSRLTPATLAALPCMSLIPFAPFCFQSPP